MEASDLRQEFPVLDACAYLNAGTDGPIPARAAQAVAEAMAAEVRDGRARAHFERRAEGAAGLRERYASLLGCATESVALTTCTTEGVATVVGGLDLGPGAEILTSDEEHPGLLGALQAARDLRGASVRIAPFAEIADAVGPRTRLVATSHVSWVTGRRCPEALRELDVPVLLDGAQGIGAVDVDLAALGADFYAGAGQKWLCGPDGTGMLYVSPAMLDRLAVARRGYGTYVDAGAGLDGELHPNARRMDTLSLSAEAVAFATASFDVLAERGWPAIHRRAAELAATLAQELRDRGREVAPRDATTLVTFAGGGPDAVAVAGRLAEAGVVVRSLPGGGWLRASVGAWNDAGDLDRLLSALG